MKELTELEIQLRSWAPRPPSARLEQNLFASHPPGEATDHASRVTRHPSPVTRHASRVTRHGLPGFHLRWIAPATAALVLLCVLYNQREAGSAGSPANAGRFLAVISSNQSAAAYLPSSFQRAQNGPPADTFKWTNVSGSTSSIRSLSPLKAQH